MQVGLFRTKQLENAKLTPTINNEENMIDLMSEQDHFAASEETGG